MDGKEDGWMDEKWFDGFIDVQMDETMVGWMDGQMDERMV